MLKKIKNRYARRANLKPRGDELRNEKTTKQLRNNDPVLEIKRLKEL
jgi:hypothetical protein